MSANPRAPKSVTIYFIDKAGTKIPVAAPIGLSLLEIAHKNNIDLEGACGGALACSTCHLILDTQSYDSLPPASEDEENMLDLAFGLTATSRLGCQILVTEAMDERLTVSLPTNSRNIMLEV